MPVTPSDLESLFAACVKKKGWMADAKVLRDAIEDIVGEQGDLLSFIAWLVQEFNQVIGSTQKLNDRLNNSPVVDQYRTTMAGGMLTQEELQVSSVNVLATQREMVKTRLLDDLRRSAFGDWRLVRYVSHQEVQPGGVRVRGILWNLPLFQAPDWVRQRLGAYGVADDEVTTEEEIHPQDLYNNGDPITWHWVPGLPPAPDLSDQQNFGEWMQNFDVGGEGGSD